ncbi:ParB/RepB/Spo0J family partition protein [Pantoea ananatis]|uniref:ParB/RepB/Spo0J family partition protein n=1 Tax=Pantoea ananas TaxID=553 RepID=UPI002361018C|nr:ParB/RepB/Spo0J family partition protein [Pantoea ananatis]
MKELKKMGRTLGNSSFSKMLSETESVRIFTLKSGAEARFTLTKILHDNIETQTYVNNGVNGRDQTFLTEHSVSDIIRTIKLQQFFPAIGREIKGRIEVLDGSRRRAACLYSGMPFEILVTKDEISLSDARQLAIDIQTAREHTLRELGKRLKLMYPEHMNQSDIAAAEGLSPAKVTRAFQAASVPDEMIAVFPSASELSINDYKTLLDIAEKATSRQVSVEELVSCVRERIGKDLLAEHDDVTVKTKIINHFRSVCADPKNARAAKKIQIEKIAEFSDKKQFARKKTDAEKRLTIYEFSRLPAAWQAEMDDAIKSVIEKMLKK